MHYGPDIPAARDELPDSLLSAQSQPLGVFNPKELDALALRPQKILPLPEGLDPVKARLMANLAQFRGRSPEGQRKALANLPRKVRSEKVSPMNQVTPVYPAGMTKAAVPAVLPIHTKIEQTFIGRMKKRVLSKEEYDLFERTWIATLTEHPEYDNPSDHHDVLTICQETINMFRIELWEHNNPGRSKADLYTAASNRLDRARRNLADRRVDRVGSKANLKSQTNIAIMAGHVDPNKKIERLQKATQDQEDELRFLESTRKLIEPKLPTEFIEHEPVAVPLPSEDADKQ